ncbi:MAG: dephospho-CoA kinase [Paludibacteraceae bacterium]|nr:dephospho-CoA kinase [Paludibacteraceae bacterium]
MKKIGICGGIGSGKSVVSRVLRNLGFDVYDSDSAAKSLMNTDISVRAALIEKFGKEVYDGEFLDRKFLAQRIFSNDQDRIFVNQVVHPVVANDFLRWAASLLSSKLVFIESAILYESEIAQLIDASIFVDAPLDIRVERVMRRNDCSKDDAFSRIAAQNVELDKAKSQFIIQNNNKGLVSKQLIAVLNQLI